MACKTIIKLSQNKLSQILQCIRDEAVMRQVQFDFTEARLIASQITLRMKAR